MNVDLSDEWRQRICVLDLLQCDIFSLRKLEKILLAVNDLQSAFCIEETDIARVKPAFIVDSLLCVLLVLVVAREDVLASNEDFTSWVGLVSVLGLFVSSIDNLVGRRRHTR